MSSFHKRVLRMRPAGLESESDPESLHRVSFLRAVGYVAGGGRVGVPCECPLISQCFHCSLLLEYSAELSL